jgi:hypothetical protein
MAASGGGMRVADVRAVVEALPGGPVSRFTIADHLLNRSTRVASSYERLERGRFQLIRRDRRQRWGEVVQ